ncbi:hypothetical protein CEXT_680261 [Caerostris extrusa]|uniref:Uncharacterized protein n=1 Tax=Caerostris extrusa TaxID=172846 RepID=A0AAV4T2K1_CAEEX|nr:hypothetical protein CEXT_680261 [Caerostris extrusa]
MTHCIRPITQISQHDAACPSEECDDGELRDQQKNRGGIKERKLRCEEHNIMDKNILQELPNSHFLLLVLLFISRYKLSQELRNI